MLYSRQSYGLLPHQPGVYQLLNKAGEVLYVGKAKDLRNRVSSYFTNPEVLIGKTKVLVSHIQSIQITVVESELESLLLEASLIKKYNPKYNIRLTDGKAYPLIRITIASEYPSVLTARQMLDAQSLYFGPYPNSSDLRKVLRLLRKIFPYQGVITHQKKHCLYYHLGLCPCPPTFTTDEQKKSYKKTLQHIIGFLEGRAKYVVKDLIKERNVYAENEAYEKADKIQHTLDAIETITQPFVRPFAYIANPNLREDVRKKEMEAVQNVLGTHGIPIGLPKRIECFDNSNIQGTNPTSSMVVLTNGEMDKKEYRKFKIRTVIGANDFATMEEVLKRRFKHIEWPYPDLLVVDGGKGQVSSAKKVLKQINVSIPLIGLAKREETIITSDFQEIRLPKSSPALRIIMRIRNEAHRFAIAYHRNLRSKITFD